MAIYIKEGEIIEGKKAAVIARRAEWKGLKEEPITGKKMTLYELDRNSSVEITEALQLNEEEILIRKQMNVHGEVGDTIKGDAIRLWVDSKRNSLKFDTKEGVSGRHGANLASTNKRTVSKLKYSFENYKRLFNHSAQVESNIKGQIK
jgi:hypothetical protein|nr:hypothetical protein [uncultured Prevotella sp.]DAM70210.1 MAG TPA: hypothetical protein [Caudoviricetes sp.]